MGDELEQEGQSTASGSPVEVIRGEVVPEVPPDEFEPDTGFEIDFTGSWQSPRAGAKNAWREGVRVEDGMPVVVYENGSVRKNDGSGHWIKSGRVLDSDSARETVQARWEKAQAYAARGLAEAYADREGVSVPLGAGNETEFKAWQAVVKSRAQIALDPNRGRDGTDAARAVGRWTGMTRDEKEGSGGEGGLIRIEITGAKALEALRMLGGGDE